MHNEVTLKRIAIFTIVIFYASVFLFSVNIPQQDDYDSILAYLLGSQDDLGSGLFDMHVSHRIVLTRLLAKFSLVFGNGVDFFADLPWVTLVAGRVRRQTLLD